MEEKKKSLKISLSKFILLIILLVMLIIVSILYIINIIKPHSTNQIPNKDEMILDIESINNDNIEEYNDENRQESDIMMEEEIKENMEGYSIEELIDIIYAEDFYRNTIEEFDSIENASQDYLFGVANKSLLINRVDKDKSNLKYEDFNNELVRTFGEKADRLLKKENISENEYTYNEDTDTYSIIGRDGSENNTRNFIIEDIIEDDNKCKVTICEYIWKSVNEKGELVYIDEASNIWICGLDGKKIIEFDNKEEKNVDGENIYYTYKIYDQDGNIVEDIKEYLKEHVNSLKDKRTINMEYEKENNRYVVVSNEIVK